jgi:hypothetical protein
MDPFNATLSVAQKSFPPPESVSDKSKGLLQAITKLTFGSNSCNRCSCASPGFISQNTFNGCSTDFNWATNLY